MKILFLDDMPQRWHTFCTKIPDKYLDDCYYAESYDEAVELVEDNGVDYFTHYFLDHDLNEEDYASVIEADEHYGSTSEEGSKNGTVFARWMVENKCKADVIVCHSMNPAGRDKMQSILKGQCSHDVFDAPFGWKTPERFLTTK